MYTRKTLKVIGRCVTYVMIAVAIIGCATIVESKDNVELPPYVHKIFDDLVEVAEIGHPVVLVGKAHVKGLAAANCYQVLVGTDLLKALQHDKDMIAMVLGHELAHVKNKDCIFGDPEHQEIAADKLGAKFVHDAGYDCVKGAKEAIEFGKTWPQTQVPGRNSAGTYYPGGPERYKIMVEACKVYAKISEIKQQVREAHEVDN